MNGAFHLPVEQNFNEFVKNLGGESVENLLPKIKGEKRADYLFRSLGVIAELKCLEHDLFTQDCVLKLNTLVNDWQSHGLIRVFGRVQIELRRLPKRCQEEWLRILEQPLNRNIVSRANRQIRDTKVALGLPQAKGVLLIANEASRSMTPADIFSLLSRILNKKKAGGAPVCSSIHWIVLFSTNVAVRNGSDPRPMTFWRAAYRSGPDEVISRFLIDMHLAWERHCAEQRGVPLKEVDVSKVDFEEVRFV